MKGSSQHNTNQKAVGPEISGGGTKATIVGSSIGSVAPIAKGMDVNNNSKAQPHKGGLGGAAASHMSTGHSGDVWSPRVKKARAQAIPYPRQHGHPVNHAKPALKRVKPD